MVVMDRGIATEANIDWLKEHNFRYLVVSRERSRQFDESQAIETTTASEETIKIQRVLSDDGTEVRLYCHSEKRREKETAMTKRFSERFEQGLAKLAAGLEKKRGNKDRDKLLEKIGRLKEKSHGIGQHYTITVTCDESGVKATALTWEKAPVDGTQMTHPGIYCLRSNETTWNEVTLWQTYTMLTDLEAVFRSLKSEPGTASRIPPQGRANARPSVYNSTGLSGSASNKKQTESPRPNRKLVNPSGDAVGTATGDRHLQTARRQKLEYPQGHRCREESERDLRQAGYFCNSRRNTETHCITQKVKNVVPLGFF